MPAMPSLRLRGRRWQRIRERQLRLHPLCAECLKSFTATPASEVDHIVRLEDGGTNDGRNLQSLCHECHAAKTAIENGSARSGFDLSGMPTDSHHPWKK